MDTSKSLTFPSLNSEADSEIVSLAAAWDCAVPSNDSDFFIYQRWLHSAISVSCVGILVASRSKFTIAPN